MTLEPRGDVVRLSTGNWIGLLAVILPLAFGGGAAVMSMKADLAVVKSKQDDAKDAFSRMDERVLRIERMVKQP